MCMYVYIHIYIGMHIYMYLNKYTEKNKKKENGSKFFIILALILIKKESQRINYT